MSVNPPRFSKALLGAVTVVLLIDLDASQAQYGVVFPGAGPVNRSIGGVAVANPLSPSGAMYWNPATITSFECSEMDFGAELLLPDSSLSSSIPANSFGPGIPPTDLAGRTNSDTTVFTLPSFGLVYQPEGRDFALGAGMSGLAGFGTDYAGSLTNPILSPPAPGGVGFGPIYSDYQVLQINLALAYRVTDRFSVAVGPNVDIARLAFDPGVFLPPNDANGDGFFSYPTGTRNRATWGAGFTVGVYYEAETWAAGASYKSRQFFDDFRYNTFDELGRPQLATVNLDIPAVVSVGFAYTGIERWVFACDLRYVGYEDVESFSDSGFSPAGNVVGLGFDDCYGLAVGAQHQWNETIALRAGYNYGPKPIPDELAAFNVASPVLPEHFVTAGMTFHVTEDFTLSVAYAHAFENSIAGPLLTPAGAVPGASVGSTASVHSIIIGASVKFGRGKGDIQL